MGMTPKQLAYQMYCLGTAILSRADFASPFMKRAGELRPGDLVMERSAAFRVARNPDEAIQAIGHLVRVEDSPTMSPGQWEKVREEWGKPGAGYDECPRERRHRITLFDGEEITWSNAMFFALPDKWPSAWEEEAAAGETWVGGFHG